MKTYLFFGVVLALLLLGCTTPQVPAATATPADHHDIVPAPDGIVTADVQADMDHMMEEQGEGTSLGKGEMTQTERAAMAQNTGTGSSSVGPNPWVNVQYDVAGSVSIVERDGKKYLRLENFKTTNGPGLKVYLSKDLEASDYISLGDLKGKLSKNGITLFSKSCFEYNSEENYCLYNLPKEDENTCIYFD